MAGRSNETFNIIYKMIADTKDFDGAVKKSKDALGEVPDLKVAQGQEDMLNNAAKAAARLKQEAIDEAKALREAEKAAKALNKELGNTPKTTKGVTKKPSSTFEADMAAYRAAGQQAQTPTMTDAEFQEYLKNIKPSGPPVSQVGSGGQNVNTFVDAYAKTFARGKKGLDDLRTGVKATEQDFRVFSAKSQEELEKIAQGVDKGPTRTLRQLGKQLSGLVRDFRGFERIGGDLTRIGTTLSIAGAAITGGIFKVATDYISKAPEANKVTRDWATSMERVDKAGMRVGKVLAAETIPFLNEGARLLNRLAGFLEKHPEAAANALKTGLVLTGVGAIIGAVGKGITLVSDATFLAASLGIIKGGETMVGAAATMNVAADKFVLSAESMALNQKTGYLANFKKGVFGSGEGAIGLLGDVAVSLAAFAGGLIIADKAFDHFQKHDQQFADYITTWKQTFALDAKGLGDWIGKGAPDPLGIRKLLNIPEDLGDDWFKAVRDALFKVEDASDAAADGLDGISDVLAHSLKREEALKAYEDYKADDLAIVAKHMADRKKIVEDSLADELRAIAKYAADVRNIQAKEATDLRKAADAYNKENDKGEEKYKKDRKELLKDSNKDILKIESDLQENLRKLHDDYAEREVDLLAARDAVGLIKNRQKYLKDQSEAQRNANKEIVQRRADLKQKLEDLQTSYSEERKQRLADYKAKVLEIQQNAKDELEQLKLKHEEEMKQIYRDRNIKLKELDTQFIEERKRRVNSFIAQLRDLDASLLGQENLQKLRHAEMLKELDYFLTKYRSGTNTLTAAIAAQAASSGNRQTGGYVKNGMYRLHDNEYVLTPYTTRVLEQLMGGQLTQSGVLAMAGGTSNKTQVTWNDSRRFDSRLQASDRRAINEDTIGLLDTVVNRI